jgi:hypoxanthine-DNA glycosylase
MSQVIRSFKPFADRRARVLILGSMPGPEALRKKQFYGFDGNHFWHIIPRLFGVARPPAYGERLRLIKKNRIALWDVLHSCVRPTAMDSDIRKAKPNKIPQLLKKYPNIKAIFINGQTAYKIFQKSFDGQIDRPVYYLPSTSPAHATMKFEEKVKKWSVIKKWIKKK